MNILFYGIVFQNNFLTVNKVQWSHNLHSLLKNNKYLCNYQKPYKMAHVIYLLPSLHKSFSIRSVIFKHPIILTNDLYIHLTCEVCSSRHTEEKLPK